MALNKPQFGTVKPKYFLKEYFFSFPCTSTFTKHRDTFVKGAAGFVGLNRSCSALLKSKLLSNVKAS